jgi:asparagine synthase (glutamine-hydrolysing)
MCGIAGWFDLRGQREPNRGMVRAMCLAIAHRGPDGDGFHFEPGVGFGHRRLAVIDLISGGQPMLSRDQSVCLIFNGEIYNFQEIRARLESLGRYFVTKSDTEVLLQAWEEWGTNCVSYLTGMFAFAVWDRAQQTLFLARDRLGEKPLYYALLPDGTLAFGSEIKALLQNPSVPREVDACAIEEFLSLGYIAEPRTIYQAVKQLPAGCVLLVRRGQRVQLSSYWDPQPAEISQSEINHLDEALLDRLGAIVKSQLVADVPVGAFLSGGVDSTVTAALMAKVSGRPIKAFTIGFREKEFDETAHAALTANRCGAEHVVSVLTEDNLDLVERLPKIFDEPFGDSSALPTFRLMALAREQVTVALSGDGGDELFAGYRRYHFHAKEEWFRKLLPLSVRGPLFGGLAWLYPQMDWAPRALRARHTLEELSADTDLGYFHNVSVVDDRTRKALYNPAMKRSLQGYHAVEVLRQFAARAPTDDPVTRAQYIDIKTWLPSDILTKVDRTAMANSLEVRVPMLDHNFVNWALGLPISAKRRGSQGKLVLKKAVSRLLPEIQVTRPKQGFSMPLAQWFRGSMGRQLEAKLLAKREFSAASFLDPAKVWSLVEQHRSGRIDNSRTLWLIWMLEAFLEREAGAESSPLARADTLSG